MNGFDITWIWAFGILGLAAGFGVGVFIGFRFLSNNERADELERELDAARAERQDYQQQVTAHFTKTAELFRDMTESYRGVYQHLAEGANQLCDETSQTARLDLADTLGLGEPQQATSTVSQSDTAARPAIPPEEVSQEEAPRQETSQQQETTQQQQSTQQDNTQEESTKPRFQSNEKSKTSESVTEPTAANAASEFEPGTEEEEKDQAILH